MFVVLYRWRLKPGMEDLFANGWSDVTKHFLENYDSLGSRLHKGDDGIWYAYAQWKSAEQRKNASEDSKGLENAFEKMGEATEERFEETILEVHDDMLKADF